MATFGELWTAILPAAVPVGTPTAAQLAREVGWVRVLKARVPAFDALEAGDVAIVPAGALAVVAPTPPEAEPLADALAAAGCAGILAVEGDDDASLGALCRAAVGLGLPVLRVARMDPNGLERGAIGYLVNRRAELEHRAGELEATLEEVALGSGDVDALIAAVAGFLGRAVALEGRPGEVLAIHAPDGAQGAAAAVGSYLAGSRAAALRIALPAPSAGDDGGDTPAATGGADEDPEQRHAARGSGGDAPVSGGGVPVSGGDAPGSDGGVPVSVGGARRSDSGAPASGSRAVRAFGPGRLVLLGERPPTELERLVAPRVARLLALELARADAVRRARDAGRTSESLPADGPPWVMLMARQLAAGPGGGASAEEREEMRSRLRAIAPARRLALRGDAQSLELRIVLAIGGAAGSDGADAGPAISNYDVAASGLVTRVAALLDRPVAASRPFAEIAGRPAAEAEARATLEAIESLTERPRVGRADRLPAYRLLAALPSLPDGRRSARALLEPLLVGTADAQRERLSTLRAVLDQPGFNEAAIALGVHRNTLAYRLRRIEQLTGWRLSDPALRLPLSIAVRLVQPE